ncbi:hypothetical protein PENTCL1PPCAC_27072, partial [Pristionchus entomophagus]
RHSTLALIHIDAMEVKRSRILDGRFISLETFTSIIGSSSDSFTFGRLLIAVVQFVLAALVDDLTRFLTIASVSHSTCIQVSSLCVLAISMHMTRTGLSLVNI